MPRKRLSSILLSLLLAGTALSTQGNSGLDTPDGTGYYTELFAGADANGDGNVTLAEAQAAAPILAVLSRAIDADNNGAITAAERRHSVRP